MGDETFDRLLEYTRHYHAHLSGKLATLRPDVLPHHGEATELVTLIQASDGYAVFYLPVPDDPTIQKGHHTFDLSKYDLNRICQSVSVNRLQMAPPLIGEAWDKTPLCSRTLSLYRSNNNIARETTRTRQQLRRIFSLSYLYKRPIVGEWRMERERVRERERERVCVCL